MPATIDASNHARPRLGWLDTAGYRILWIQWIQDTAGYAAFSCVRVQLRSAWIQVCVQLRSGTCVQLRSAFSCVLRSAFSCVLRSAAFCVQLRSGICVQLRSAFSCVQLGYSQAQSKASGWAFSVGKAGTHGPIRVVILPWQLGMSTRTPSSQDRICVHLLILIN